MSLTLFPNGISSQGVPIYGGSQDISGTTYFVDGNCGNDGNVGTELSAPYKTLAKAIAVSNTDIARGSDRWARRNTIYIAGDNLTENLVAFPNKCDVVGMGSDDAFTMACIEGNHVPVNAGNMGTRFINVRLLTKAAGIIVDLVSSSSGISFINCLFDATGTATATTGIRATASPRLIVKGCKFEGAFSTSYITFGTGQALGTTITDNIMVQGAAGGILTGAGTTASYMGVIARNIVQVAGLAIDTQATSVFVVANNSFITTTGAGATSAIVDLTFACNNTVTQNDVSTCIPVIVDG